MNECVQKDDRVWDRDFGFGIVMGLSEEWAEVLFDGSDDPRWVLAALLEIVKPTGA